MEKTEFSAEKDRPYDYDEPVHWLTIVVLIALILIVGIGLGLGAAWLDNLR